MRCTPRGADDDLLPAPFSADGRLANRNLLFPVGAAGSSSCTTIVGTVGSLAAPAVVDERLVSAKEPFPTVETEGAMPESRLTGSLATVAGVRGLGEGDVRGLRAFICSRSEAAAV